MRLIKLSLLALLLVAATTLSAAPPAPGSIGVSTNTPFLDQSVVTNVAVSLPAGDFVNSVIYSPSKSIKQGIQITWSVSAGATGYALYYGDANTPAAPTRFDVKGNTGVVFFGLSTTTTYYVYVAAYDATLAEGAKSGAVLFKPGS